ncbi:HPr family phosphocarrier protein [Candidatus Chlamydia sanziniae]|nr:HPr family phosphocarrier protein [Candidatus Chlamydia sanziniae]
MISKSKEYSGICLVKNASGIHVRPAGVIVRLFEEEDCEVRFTYAGKTVNARSIMSILMLGAPQGGKIFVSVKGNNALCVLEKLQTAFETGFGEL